MGDVNNYQERQLQNSNPLTLGPSGCESSERLTAIFRALLLLDSILPGLEGLDAQLPPATRLAQAVEMNVRWTLRAILDSPEGRARQAEGRVKCVGAIYEIETGRVRFLEKVC